MPPLSDSTSGGSHVQPSKSRATSPSRSWERSKRMFFCVPFRRGPSWKIHLCYAFNSSGGGCCKFLGFPLLSLLSPWPGEVKVHFEQPAHLADCYQNGKMLTTSHCHMLGTFVWPIATWFDYLISIHPDIVILSILSLEPCLRENTKVFKASWCSGPSSFFNIEFYVGQFFIHKPVYVFFVIKAIINLVNF